MWRLSKTASEEQKSEQATLAAIRLEFEKLKSAFEKYCSAMIDRLGSYQTGQVVRNRHDYRIGNSHQREIDGLRNATSRFAKKMGVSDSDGLNKATGQAANDFLDKLEINALL